MLMLLKRLPPGMEHQGEADLPAEPSGITAKGLQGGGGALEEEAVEDLGIALSQGIELMGQGQHAMEIGCRPKTDSCHLESPRFLQGFWGCKSEQI